MKIRTKFIVITTVIVAAALISVTTACLIKFNQELRREAMLTQETRIKTFWELLQHKGSDFKVVDGKLMIGDYNLNNNFELPDRLKDLCGGTATIFMGDERISTNVIKADGSRALGTKLTGPAYQSIFKEGRSYRGETEILGVPYFTAYDPIRNAQGDIIGVLSRVLRRLSPPAKDRGRHRLRDHTVGLPDQQILHPSPIQTAQSHARPVKGDCPGQRRPDPTPRLPQAG